jgi:predicted extracellular nuclease
LNGWFKCSGSTSLQTLSRGQKVRVTGVIKENFFETRMQEVSQVEVVGSGTITPLSLSPNTFTTYSFADNEKYEGMLINLRNPNTNEKIFVVDANADGADLATNNFAEYRVGMDVFDPNAGTRILAGRVNTSTFSSLSVSYVNDPRWAAEGGAMLVDVKQVTEGTSFDSIVGVVTYTFSNMKMLPRNNNDFYNVNYLLNAKSVVEKNNANIVMYPNPATETIVFEGIEKASIVTIYNAMGAVIAERAIDYANATISLDGLANGTYLVKVQDANNILYQNKLTVIK